MKSSTQQCDIISLGGINSIVSSKGNQDQLITTTKCEKRSTTCSSGEGRDDKVGQLAVQYVTIVVGHEALRHDFSH
jgi:hypothetical protein